MPFNVSNPVLYYNKKAFQKAGLDPNKPPTTLDEVRAASQKIDRHRARLAVRAFGLKLDPWYLEHWLAQGGQALREQRQRPRERGDQRSTFDNTAGREIFAWLDDMVEDGSRSTPPTARGPSTTCSAIGNGNVGDDDRHVGAALGTILAGARRRASSPTSSSASAPMPGPAGKGGVLVGGAALLHPEEVVAGEAGGGVEVRQVPQRAGVAGRVVGRHRVRADPASRADEPASGQAALGRRARATRSRTTSCSAA